MTYTRRVYEETSTPDALAAASAWLAQPPGSQVSVLDDVESQWSDDGSRKRHSPVRACAVEPVDGVPSRFGELAVANVAQRKHVTATSLKLAIMTSRALVATDPTADVDVTFVVLDVADTCVDGRDQDIQVSILQHGRRG
jgi:hypothetical protein